ncbi:glycosyltransferase family 2 protein [Noviherbaspirillum soli]|uniref:glycosyltransferase family 2 protein n=1 Tax=Noviherbaspirillum soli TaxID=1064518 RepID=UPI00188DBC58
MTETIQSALDQTRPFHEIIVVDDCSTDDTLAVLASFGDWLTVIASDKVDVQVARNKGMAAARRSTPRNSARCRQAISMALSAMVIF